MPWVSVDDSYHFSDLYLHVVLHPCHKLAYFKHTKWEDNWVESAETLVRETYECSYSVVSPGDSETDEDGIAMEASSVSCLCFCVHSLIEFTGQYL